MLTEHKLKPNQIVLLGDSAGGNLCVALLGLLSLQQMGFGLKQILDSDDVNELLQSKFNPFSTDPELQINSLPTGCALISPWLDLTQSTQSYKTNAEKDLFLPPEYVSFASENYIGSKSPPHFLASPHQLPLEVLQSFPPHSSSCLRTRDVN